MGFRASNAEPDIWLRLNQKFNVYEYIAVYVDDLAIACKNCDEIITILTDKYGFKLKGTEKSSIILGWISTETKKV